MQIIPAIDLKDGKCVRLEQGALLSAKTYSGDPFSVARKFVDAGATLIHVIDLDGAFNGVTSINRSIVKELASTSNAQIQVGGGIRMEQHVDELIQSGVARVVLGTLATQSLDRLERLVKRFGSQICVGIDARDGVVMTHGWESATELKVAEFAGLVASVGIERIIYTDIKRDGMLSGPNIEQTVALARSTGIKVTASGGVSTLDDLARLRESGEPLVDSVIVGKALYEKRFTFEEALQLTAENKL